MAREGIKVLFIFGLIAISHQYDWQLSRNWSGYSLFGNFTFWDQSIDGTDPTQGYVYYANEGESWEWGYVNVTEDGGAYIGCDYWSIATGTGRGSVRLTSNEAWEHGLFIADIEHMPQGCGTWPAYWFFGPDWPNNGEIDVIEGVNLATNDQTTLHTGPNCNMTNYYYSDDFTGKLVSSDCYAEVNGNAGCGIEYLGQGSYGAEFNENGGGVYALQWLRGSVSSWYFPRGTIPSDITKLSPDPSSWGTPYAYFPLNPTNCDPDHFNDMNMVINLTFCGQWAGSVFADDCGVYYGDDCNAYVQNNPADFADAYWIFNSIQVYQ